MATKTLKQQKDAVDWWMGRARTAAGYRKKLMDRYQRAYGYAVIGRMYCFWYEAKYKDVLPMYDRFPLVFPIEEYNNGFLGLNLHYLDGEERQTLLDLLKGYATNTRFNHTTKLRLSYRVLSGLVRSQGLIRPCIKRYLWSHVRSHFIEVYYDEWDKVAALPTASFVYKR